jgi:hypothetical protein
MPQEHSAGAQVANHVVCRRHRNCNGFLAQDMNAVSRSILVSWQGGKGCGVATTTGLDATCINQLPVIGIGFDAVLTRDTSGTFLIEIGNSDEASFFHLCNVSCVSRTHAADA